MATPAVGCRVRILKDYATVRYVGSVAKQDGIWVGVEWDDPSRGKHDGSTGGVRYFECKSGANAGSFVRIERVCFGVLVLDALRARYNNETAEHGEEVAADELYVHTSRQRRVQVKLIGEEKIQQKQRQIHSLESARLVGLDVSAVGDADALRAAVPRLTEFDLTCNLIASWGFAEQLAQALPNLAFINLSENKMELPAVRAPSPAGAVLPSIRVLVLNDCGITWHQVLAVAPQLPNLEELHLCGNPIGSLDPPATVPEPSGQQAPDPSGPHHGLGPESDCAGEAAAASSDTAAKGGEEQQECILHKHQPAVEADAGQERPAQTDQGTHQDQDLTSGSDDAAAERVTAGGGSGQAGGAESHRSEPEVPSSAAAAAEAAAVTEPTAAQDGAGAAAGAGHPPGSSGLDSVIGGGEDEEVAAEVLASLFPRLQVLTLEEAQLAGWRTLELLRRLPALTRLHLAGNTAIADIRYPRPRSEQPAPEAPAAASPSQAADPAGAGASAGVGEAAAPAAGVTAELPSSSGSSSPAFPSLTALYLGGCGVANWAAVDQLDLFPALRELRLTGNPVLGLSRAGGRFEVIGRVSRLTQLNGAEVRPRERRDSELRYLQHIAAEMEAAGQDEARRGAVRAAHPRLRKLMELHGTVLATAARGASAGGSLAASMVELKLTCVAAAAHAKMGSQAKKLPRSTTVSALRLLCERLFKVKSDRLALFLRAPGDPLPENIGGADQEDRQLGFFGVQDGYEVLVDEADPEESKKADEDARAAAAAAHEQRLAEQLRAAEKLQAEFARSMGLQHQ